MIVGGIDPGITGGLAVVNEWGHCETAEMPVFKDEQGKSVVDGGRALRFLSERDVEFVIIERVSAMPKQGVTSSFTFGFVTGQVRSVAQMLLGCEPKLVEPQVWKKAFGLIKQDKHKSREVAARMFPKAADQFARVKDHGRAEAALIAAYHLNMHLRSVAA